MFFASKNRYFASTGAEIDSVMESPTIETNVKVKSESAVSANQEPNKRRMQFIEGEAAEQGPPTKRMTPFSFSHSSLDTDVNIFDSDGLFIVPDESINAEINAQFDSLKGPPSLSMDQTLQSLSSPFSAPHVLVEPTMLPHVPQPSGLLSLDYPQTQKASSPPGPSETDPQPVVDQHLNTSEIVSIMPHPNPLENLVANIVRNLGTISQLATTSPNAQPHLLAQLNSASELVQSALSTISRPPTSHSPLPIAISSPQLPLTLPVPSVPLSRHPIAQPVIGIRLTGKMETIWYADRPYPGFDCELVDLTSQQPFRTHGDCVVRVVLLDGEDAVVDKLTGQAASFNFEFPVNDGCVSITGLRFGAVSSKHGGYFRLRLEIASDELDNTTPFFSDKIQVLSYRLFHARKVDFSKLKRTDAINKVKGIGSLYAKRFAEIGIETVEQLAELDVDSLQMGSKESKRLLESLRKDRGALTLAKLNEYISQAREIVQRGDDSASDDSSNMPSSTSL